MPTKTKRVTRSETNTIELTQEEIEEALRQHFNIPSKIAISWNISWGDTVDGATVQWTETSEEDVDL